MTVIGYVAVKVATQRATPKGIDGAIPPEPPETVYFEAGTRKDQLLLAAHVVDENRMPQYLGQRISGKLSFSGFMSLVDGGLEQGSNITAPDEMAPLRKANYELVFQPL